MHRISFKVWMAFTLFLASAASGGAEYEWQQFNHLDRINSIVFNGDTAWIGSDIGLGRLSIKTGQTFFYNYANSGCPVATVTQIAADRDNIKWLATPTGIARFDGRRWECFDTTNSIMNSQNVTQVTVDSNNTKWFACAPNYLFTTGTTIKCWGGGLVRFDGNEWTRFDSTDPGLRTSSVYKLAAGRHELWLLTSRGLCRRNVDSTWVYLDSLNSPLPTIGCRSVQIDLDGAMWVLYQKHSMYTDSNFLAGLDTAGRWTLLSLNDSLPKGMGRMLDFSIDRTGRHWFREQNVGFCVWDKKTWTPYYYKNSELPQRINIQTVAFDESNRLWFDMFDDTVRIFDAPSLTKFRIQDSKLPFRGYISMARDKKGIYWLGSYNGVVRMVNDSFTVFDTSNSELIYNYRIKVAVDSANRKWFGSNCGGMSMFDNISWSSFRQSDSTIPDNCVNDLLVDKGGLLWLAFSSGVATYNGTSYDYEKIPQVTGLGLDTFGRVWAGSMGSGAYLFRNHEWHFMGPDSSGLGIWGLTCAPDGKIWCSTDKGIFCSNGDTWKHFDTLDTGIPIHMDPLMIDRKANAWAVTSRGLIFYDGITWSTLTGSESGCPGLGKLLLDDNEGNLWFTTTGGLACRSVKARVAAFMPVLAPRHRPGATMMLPYMGKPIKIALEAGSIPEISVCAVNGKTIRKLTTPHVWKNSFYVWDGMDASNRHVAYGIYLIVVSGH
jgi:ligand-binding sensor domain-containing protein